MSQNIDERVVEMQFNNKDFEKNANQSIETLDKLEKSLKLDGANRGLAALQQTAQNFTLNMMVNAVDTVQEKFSAFEHIAVGALERIGQQAEQTAERYLKMFTVDNISAGWQKFGDKTTSVATLVSQLNPETGENYSLEEVNTQLERLNWFTDETSYNFTDMVGNIAKFTATGQGLETSVSAMEGIALWASRSGQNAQKASMAMYQLSQAMGKGALKYDDYKSIQNASMDTQEFRKAALDTAVALGKVEQAADGAYTVAGKTFEDMNAMFTSDALSRTQWLDTDVMMNTFNKYGSAVEQIYEFTEKYNVTASEAIKMMEKQGIEIDKFGLDAFKAGQEARTFGDVVDSVQDAVSTGWMNTFEKIFGNYEEARNLWTDMANELYDIFAEGGNKRNLILGMWYDEGGRTSLINGFKNLYNAFKNFITPIGNAWKLIFPPRTSEQARDLLLNLTKGFESFSEKILAMFDLKENVEEWFLDPLIVGSEKLGKVIPLDEIRQFAGFIDEAGKPIGNFAKFMGDAADTADDLQDEFDKTKKTLEDIETVAHQVINGDWGNGQERIDRLREAGYCFEEIQNRVNELLGCSYRYEGFEKENSDTVADNNKELGAQADALGDIAEAEEGLKTPSHNALKNIGRVQRIFLGLFSVVDMCKQVLEGFGAMLLDVANYAWEVAGAPFVEWVIDSAAALGEELLIMDMWMRKSEPFKEVFEVIADTLKSWIDVFVAFAKEVWPSVKKAFKEIGNILGAVGGIIWNFIKAAWPVLEQAFGIAFYFIGKIVEALGRLYGKAKETYETLRDSGALERFGNAIKSVWEPLKELGLAIAGTIGSAIISFLEGLNKNKSGATEFIDNLKKIEFLDQVTNWIRTLGETIGTWRDKIFEFFESFADESGTLSDGKALFGGVDFSNNKGFIEGVKSFLETAWKTIVEWIKGLPERISTNLSKASGTISQTLQKVFGDFNLEKFIGNAKGITITGVLAYLGIAIANFVKNIGKVPKTFSEVLESVEGAIKAYQNNLNADSIYKIGAAILMMAGALVILSFVDSNKLQDVITSFGAFLFIVGFLVKTFTEFKKVKLGAVTQSFTGPLQAFIDGITDAFKKGMKIAGFGILMAGIGIGVALLVGAILKLTNINWGPALLATGLIVVLMGALVGAAILYNKMADNVAGFGDALVIVAFALGIKMIVNAVQDLASSLNSLGDIGKIIVSAALIGVLMFTLSKSISIGTGKTSFGQFVGYALAILAICKAVNTIKKALMELSDLDTGALLGAAVSLGLVMGALVYLSQLMGKDSAGTFGKGTVLMIALAAALWIFSDALTKLGSQSWGNIIGGLLALAVALAIFVVAGHQAEGAFTGLIGLSVAMISFGLGALLLASSLAVLGIALETIGTGLPIFVEGLAATGQLIREHGGDIAIAIAAILAAVATAIIMSKTTIATSIVELLTSIGTKIVEAAPQMLSKLWMLILIVIGFLSAVAPELVDKVVNLLLSFVNNVLITLGNSTDKIRIIIENVVALLANIVIEALDMLWDALGAILGDVPIIGDIVKKVGEGLDNVQFEMQHFAEETGTGVADSYDQAYKNEMEFNETDQLQMIKDQAHRRQEAAMEGASEAGEEPANETAIAYQDALFANEGAMSEETAALFSRVMDGSASEADMQALTDMMSNAGPAMATGVEEGGPAVSEAAENVTVDAANGAASPTATNAAAQSGNKVVEAEANSISSSSNKNKISNATKGVTKSGVSGAKTEARNGGRTVGVEVINGTINGLKDSAAISRLKTAAENMAQTAVNSARWKLRVESPSKVFRDLFAYVPEGAALGIEKTSYMVEDASAEMADGVIKSARDYVSRIYDFINNDVDVEPTITPVLDLSGIQNGTVYANRMLAGIGAGTGFYGSFADISAPRSTSEQIKDALNGAMTDISNSIYGKLNDNTNYTIEVPINLDGREVARVTAPYTRNEIDRLNRNDNRRGGTL